MEWVRILLIFIQQLEDAASQRQRLGIFVMRTKYDNLPLQGNNQDIKLAEAHLLLLQEMRSVHEGYDAIELCHSFFLLTQHVECCSEFCLCAQGIGLCRLAYLMQGVRALSDVKSYHVRVELPDRVIEDEVIAACLLHDVIEDCGKTLQCVPVIAHIDRYMRILHDQTLFERVSGRKLLIQVNASFFLHRDTQEFAVECLRRDRFHFIGSDCHNMDDRRPNIGKAAVVIREAGAAGYLANLSERQYRILGDRET